MRRIVFLRGVNNVGVNRVSMPQLRELLADFDDVRTYVQSGNVVLTSDLSPERLARECERRIRDALGVAVDVVVRTRDELAGVVELNPLRDVAADPRRYQVTFLSDELDEDVVRRLEAARAEPERLVVAGREVYAWHPDGVGRSRLWAQLAGRKLGVTATSRNWRTVTNVLAIADGAR